MMNNLEEERVESPEEMAWLCHITKSINEGAELHRKLRDECMAKIHLIREREKKREESGSE